MKQSQDVMDDQLLLLIEVASQYYEEEISQADIAERLGISRSTVSRMIKEARERGIVEIKINRPVNRSAQLEKDLKNRFSLKAARVLDEDGLSYEDTIQHLGTTAAQYLTEQLYEGATMAIGWGFAVSQVVRVMKKPGHFSVDVVQMVGSAGKVGPERDGLELARHLAEVLGGRCLYVAAPIIVQTANVAEALFQDPAIKHTLDVAERSDFAVVGIGSVSSTHSTIVESGYITDKDLQDLLENGAVGDICNQWFCADGKTCKTEINKRTVGLGLERLKSIQNVIGVAAGSIKVEAILGALNGKLINILVTDRQTAESVLRSGW